MQNSISFWFNGIRDVQEYLKLRNFQSSNIPHDTRKAAEQFFLNIRNEKFSPEYCRQVIGISTF